MKDKFLLDQFDEQLMAKLYQKYHLNPQITKIHLSP